MTRFKKNIGRTITDLGISLQNRVRELEAQLRQKSAGPPSFYYVCQVCGPAGVHISWNPSDGKCRHCGRTGVLVRSDKPALPEFKCPKCNGVIGEQFDMEHLFDGMTFVSGKPLERRIPCPCCDEVTIIQMQTSFSLQTMGRITIPKRKGQGEGEGLKPDFKSVPKKKGSKK